MIQIGNFLLIPPQTPEASSPHSLLRQKTIIDLSVISRFLLPLFSLVGFLAFRLGK